MDLAKYRKFIVAIAAFGGVLAAALSDGSMDNAEIAAVVVAGIGALGVFGVANKLDAANDAPEGAETA